MKKNLGIGEEIVLAALGLRDMVLVVETKAQDRVVDKVMDGGVPRKNVKGRLDGVAIIIVAGNF